MVRPFFKWMVSAHVPAGARAATIKRMVTRSRIQAHSSNCGTVHPRDEGTTRDARLADQGGYLADGWGCADNVRSECESAGQACGGALSATRTSGAGSGPGISVRGASLDRSAVHITLEDGTIGFTQDVMGRITGAFFEGYGEVLLTPPNEVERRSMSLFTGMAILEEHFATAYFRFNDDAASELRPDLRATEKKQEFVERWAATTRNLANADATRLLMTFSRMLPVKGNPTSSERADLAPPGNAEDRFLHARLQGTKLGVFDVYFDSAAPEQVQAGQAKAEENGDSYYNVWTSFSRSDAGNSPTIQIRTPVPNNEGTREGRVEVRRYTITTEVQPPKQIHARARVQLDVREGGPRTLLFELSRFLQVESVKLHGQ